jgi:D-alanyl-D-alanine carboxypeptidase/D-alanyl-D-alanine-endopeptidase (penicillin-binding protein 4)
LAVLAILQADTRVGARLSGALSADHAVSVHPSWDALGKALDQGPFGGCLVDAKHPDRNAATIEIARLRERHPGLAIVACVDVQHGQGYFDLGELGVDGVLPSDSLQSARVRSIVDDALAMARADRISRALKGRYAAPAPDAIGWAVENAGSDTNVEKLAAALGHTPRSLRQALEDAGFPGPTRVLLWGRLLLAAARLNRDGRTVEEVAFSLGYSTATSLSRAMKQQTGLTPRQVSEHGGMDRVRDVLFAGRDEPGPTRKRFGKIASLLLAAFTSACATLGLGGAGVDRGDIDAVVDRPPVSGAHFGVLAVDASTGRTLYARNDHQWFVPASNQKLLVTAAAWSLLGPDYRFRTEVWATGPFDSSHLDGDVVVIGSGDPSLSARYWSSDTAALEALADSLGAKGPGHVTGSLVVDVAAWDSTTVAPNREVDDLVYAYGSTGGAYAMAEGEIEVVVVAGPTVGAPATVTWSPVGTADYVQSLVITAESDSATRVVARYLPETRHLVLEGQVRLGATDSLSFAQRDPVRQAAAALARAVGGEGITIEGGWTVKWMAGEPVGLGCEAGKIPECPGARLITVLESPPLSELVAGVLGPSQNWMAEQLTLTLGAEFGERGSWEEGISVIERFLAEEVGIETLDVSARDGSGLSAYNLVTPRALVRVLQYMQARDDAESYRLALAKPGEVDSTLEERLQGLEGTVFAKTGSISNVNSLSGYLVREDGGGVIFSILSNGSGLSAEVMRDAIDDVVRVLAR